MMALHFLCQQDFQALEDRLWGFLAGETPKPWGFTHMGDLPLPKSKYKGVLHLPTLPAWQDHFKSRDEEREKINPNLNPAKFLNDNLFPSCGNLYVSPALSLFWGTRSHALIPTALVAKLWVYRCNTILGSSSKPSCMWPCAVVP